MKKLKNATSNIFLEDFLRRFKWNDFCGVFSSNSIPPHLHQHVNFSIIVNLSRRNEKGTHFIVIIKRNNTLLYLDPLALYINLNNDINNFIKDCECNVIKLTHAIQDMRSWYCGYHCMFLMLFFNKTIQCHNKLIKFEEKDLLKNDCICLHNLMIMFNEIL